MFELVNNLYIPFSHPESNLIVLEVAGQKYKISKITLHSDGGFDFHFPYHDIKTGMLYKTTHDYTQDESHTAFEELKEKFRASSKVKLSIHKSGFTQFSGPNITSGLHWFTNKPKGLAVHSTPLTHPISTGPTFSMTIRSFDGFAKYTGAPKKRENVLMFSADKIYNGSIQSNLYVLEGFVFTHELLSKIRQINGERYLKLRMSQFEVPNAEFFFRIIYLKKIENFLAISIRKVELNSDDEGLGELIYSICGPGGNKRIIGKNPVADLLFAVYPYNESSNLPSISLSK